MIVGWICCEVRDGGKECCGAVLVQGWVVWIAFCGGFRLDGLLWRERERIWFGRRWQGDCAHGGGGACGHLECFSGMNLCVASWMYALCERASR